MPGSFIAPGTPQHRSITPRGFDLQRYHQGVHHRPMLGRAHELNPLTHVGGGESGSWLGAAVGGGLAGVGAGVAAAGIGAGVAGVIGAGLVVGAIGGIAGYQIGEYISQANYARLATGREFYLNEFWRSSPRYLTTARGPRSPAATTMRQQAMMTIHNSAYSMAPTMGAEASRLHR